jgi:hypothetical protein
MLVRSDNRSIDMMQTPIQLAVRVCLLLQPLQNPLSDLGPLPAVEPASNRLPGTIALREITPRRSGAKQPEKRIDDDAVIIVWSSSEGFLWWEVRSEPLPLLVC